MSDKRENPFLFDNRLTNHYLRTEELDGKVWQKHLKGLDDCEKNADYVDIELEVKSDDDATPQLGSLAFTSAGPD